MDATIVFQKNWTASQSGYRYIINSGSSRSSKTYSIIQLFYLYALQNPNKKLSVFRDTKQICKQTVFEDMKKAYINMLFYDTVNLNVTESIFKFKNGSAIHIEGTDDSIKIHGYHCDVLWINEGYNVSKDTFDQLDMRCKDFVILDLNPRQAHWSEEIAKSENAIVIHSTFLDNPFCPSEQRIKILSYQPIKECSIVINKKLTEQDARAYNFTANELSLSISEITELARCKENERTGSANSFNYDVYARGIKSERPNRIFHWKEIADYLYDAIDAPTYYAVDWGAVDPWAILEFKYYDGQLYFKELNYASENILRAKLEPVELEQITGDSEGLVTWHFNKLGIPKNAQIICDPNRPEKIAALRRAGYSYAQIANKPSGSITFGIDTLNDVPVNFTSSSKNLKYEQENYSRKVDRYGIVLEEPEDIDNHLCDCARYGAFYLRRQGIIKKI